MSGSALTATELAEAVAALREELVGAAVRDVVRLIDKDDLLVFLDTADGALALHVVTGGRRARVTCTRRRFHREEFSTGPLVDRLRQTLLGCVLGAIECAPGERRCHVAFRGPVGDSHTLHIELFGARGFWCLVDGDEKIRELSRMAKSADRDLRPGSTYEPLPPRAVQVLDPVSRFAPPILLSIDDHFTGIDRAEETSRLSTKLRTAIDRAERRLRNKIDGLARQRVEIERVPELRMQADMLLAYGFSLSPGATSLTVPHPENPDRTLTYPLEPGKTVQAQADKLYKKARKLQDGAEMSEKRKREATEELRALTGYREDLEKCSELDELLAVQTRLIAVGLVAKPRGAIAKSGPAVSGRERNIQKLTKGYNFRRFTTIEGYLVLVGRTNRENDRLSIAVARGNDLWFHVGQGYAGSHVVLRLPKGKTASLESLLDAATIAIHFSKARNATRCEVIYTLAKNVRKPKGLPPGRVTTGNTKTITVRVETQRLQRMLDSAEAT